MFVVCLLISDLCNAIGGVISGSWATNYVVRQGTACTVQGMSSRSAPSGSMPNSKNSCLVAVRRHRHSDMEFHRCSTYLSHPRFVDENVKDCRRDDLRGWLVRCWVSEYVHALPFTPPLTRCYVLAFIGPLALQTPERGPFYGVAAQWCWVRNPYSLERVIVHYVPMLTSAFIIFCLYFLVFLTLRGTLVINGNRWRLNWGNDVLRVSPTGSSVQTRGTPMHLRSLAKKVLWYPIGWFSTPFCVRCHSFIQYISALLSQYLSAGC